MIGDVRLMPPDWFKRSFRMVRASEMEIVVGSPPLASKTQDHRVAHSVPIYRGEAVEKHRGRVYGMSIYATTDHSWALQGNR